MQELHTKYGDSNQLAILGFPCNNFGGQEPGDNDKIRAFADKKGASFRIFGKLECDNGSETHPMYASLIENSGGEGLGWNFTKFLIDAEGKPVKRYRSSVSPMGCEDDIKALL